MPPAAGQPRRGSRRWIYETLRERCKSIVTTVICVISPKEQQLTTTSIVTPIVIAGPHRHREALGRVKGGRRCDVRLTRCARTIRLTHPRSQCFVCPTYSAESGEGPPLGRAGAPDARALSAPSAESRPFGSLTERRSEGAGSTFSCRPTAKTGGGQRRAQNRTDYSQSGPAGILRDAIYCGLSVKIGKKKRS